MTIPRTDILDQIIRNKRDEVKALSLGQVYDFKRAINDMPAPNDFLKAVSKPDRVSIIAEIKKSSPSLGPIRPDANVLDMARLYEDCGAAAISVLTDSKHFGGSIADLMEVRKTVKTPILRKDFIIDEKQIYESRACGADAVLLIVAALDDPGLKDFYQTACGLGLASLVETHNAREIERALKLSPSIVGINNRCLKTLKVDLSTSENLRSMIPPGVCVISESGIRNKTDALRLTTAGMNALLIGTSIISSDDPGRVLRELTGR